MERKSFTKKIGEFFNFRLVAVTFAACALGFSQEKAQAQAQDGGRINYYDGSKAHVDFVWDINFGKLHLYVESTVKPGYEYLGEVWSLGELGYDNPPWAPYKTIATELEIGEHIHQISPAQFRAYRKLGSINLHKHISVIEYNNFRNCSGLTTIVLPENLKIIDDQAFGYCNNLKRVITLNRTPATSTDYWFFDDKGPFYKCPEDMILYAPYGTRWVYKGTWEWGGKGRSSDEFAGFSSYEEILDGGQYGNISWILPIAGDGNGRLEIFGNGIEREKGEIPDAGNYDDAPWYKHRDGSFTPNPPLWDWPNMKITELKIEDGITQIGNKAFADHYYLKKIIDGIPGTVWRVGVSSFRNCSSLTSFTLPASVTTVYSYAFQNCTGLTSFTNLNPDPQKISPEVFSGVNLKNVILYVPEESVPKYKAASVWKEFKDIRSTGSVHAEKRKTDTTPVLPRNTTVTIPVTEVLLNKYFLTSLNLQHTYDTLKATVLPENATNKEVIWSSSNPEIADVSHRYASETEIIGNSLGVAYITATTADGGKTAVCRVTVHDVNLGIRLCHGVSLNKNSARIPVNTTETLTATVSPEDATEKEVFWTSSDRSVATVLSITPSDGLVRAVAPGQVTITATTNQGGRTDFCTVTVPVPVERISLKSSTSLFVGTSETLRATISPANDKEDIIWTNSNPLVASIVPNGLTCEVTAKTLGFTDITATAVNGNKKVTCTVTVLGPVTGVVIDKSPETLLAGTSETLIANVLPEYAANKTVTWNSSDPSVVSIEPSDLTCKITALAAGEAWIRVITADGGKTASRRITVISPVTGINLKSSESLFVGQSKTLTAEVLPLTAGNKTVTWTNDNPSVATILPNGSTCEVTAVKAGGTLITATTADGGKTAACLVTVTVPVASISLDKSSSIFPVGASGTLKATVLPQTATNKTITWSSSDPSVAGVLPDGLFCTIIAVGTGDALITAAATDGSEVSAGCEVTVKIDDVLKSLSVTEYRGAHAVFPLSPVFNPDIFNYTVYVPNPVSQIAIDAEKHNPATVVDGAGIVYQLNADDRLIEIHVIAVDNETVNTYTVLATRDINAVVTDISQAAPADIQVYENEGILHLNSPVSETVSVCTVTGMLLHRIRKTAGETSLAVNPAKGILIVRGSSGWVRKLRIEN